jgi:RHS repeat-associated protein
MQSILRCSVCALGLALGLCVYVSPGYAASGITNQGGEIRWATWTEGCIAVWQFYGGSDWRLVPYDNPAIKNEPGPHGYACQTLIAVGWNTQSILWAVCEDGESASLNAEDGCVPTPASPKNNGTPICPLRTANPINVGTGNKFETVTDYRGAGVRALRFVRYYNSQSERESPFFDLGWRSNYDRSVLELSSPKRALVTRPDGRELVFVESGGEWTPDPDVTARLTQLANGWEYTDADDTIETYDANGRILSIRTRDGYEQTITWDGRVISSVSDSEGGTLTFTYADRHLVSLTDPDGRVYAYGYDERRNLSTVIYPDDTPADDTDNPTVQYHYEHAEFRAALTGITDENGERFATWAYDTERRATLSEHAGGAERTTITYEADGTATVTDALGATRTYGFTTQHEQVKAGTVSGDPCTTCGGLARSYTYDASGFLSSRTDFNGNVTTFVHDARGLETRRTEAAGTPAERTIATQWHPTFRLPTRITEPGQRTDFTYDGQGRLLSRTVTDPATGNSRTTTYTYTPEGLLETTDGPRTDVSDVTTRSYDAQGNLTSVTDALGHVTQITAHDASGRPTSIQDPNGVVTDLAYDPRGRIISRTLAGLTTSFDYDAAGNLIRVTLPDGSFLDYTYDPAHRLTAIADNLGNRIEYTLDAAGNRTREDVRDPSGTLRRTQSRVYNALSRLVQHIGGAGQTSAFAYDANGNQTQVTDPLGNPTTRAFDALNRLVSTEDALSGLTELTYDARDNLVSVTDPRGLVTTYVYDGLDNRIERTSPDTGTTTLTYDAAGNRASETDARGVTTHFTYDALNRLTAIDYPDDAEDVAFTYDEGTNGVGRLTSMADESGTITFTYDARGNLTSETAALDGGTRTVGYAYDAAERLVQITYPSGRTVDYVRDAIGQVQSITTTFAGVTETLASSIGYLPFGPMSGLAFGNGIALARSFDADYRLTAQTATPAQDLSFSYDPNDNITAITDALDAARDQAFGYDALDRLTGADGGYGHIDYAYDAVGNRTTRTENALLEVYDTAPDSNRLLQLTGGVTRSFAYDAAGNTTDDGRFSFAYGDNNRLTTVSQVGSPIATYAYNARGERVKKTAGGVTTLFTYDTSGHLLAESDAAGNPLKEYVYLDGLLIALIAPETGGGGGGGTSELVLDNAGATVAGTWPASTSTPGFEGADYQYHEPNGAPPGSVVVDNADGGFSARGEWTHSTVVSGFEGADYQYEQPDTPPPEARVVDNTDGGFSVTGTWPDSTAVSGFEGTDYQSHEPEGPPPGSVVLDNTDTGFSTIGTWLSSSSTPGFEGSDYQVHAAGSGANSATWALPVPAAGDYEVYARWTAHSNRASNAKYTVQHAGGADTVTVSQQVDGGQWNLLGTYAFDSGTAQVALTDAADGYVIADAVELVPVGAAPNTATWTFDIPTSGDYEVYAKWTAHPNRASDATYTVHHAGGATSVAVNQQQHGGEWRLIGAYTFDAGPTQVSLTDQANGIVVADAVQVVPVGTAPNTATWTLAIPATGDYDVYARWTAHPNRATDAPYTVHHAGGASAVAVNQQLDTGQWNLLGTFSFDAGGDNRVTLTDEADGIVIADAVLFLPAGSATANSVTWNPNLSSPAQYEVYAKWTAHANRASDATYTVHHALGSTSIAVDQRASGGTWNPLGTYDLDSASTIVLTDAADGYVIADAIRLVQVGAPPPAGPTGIFYVHTDHLGTPKVVTDAAQGIAWAADYLPYGEAQVTAEAVRLNVRFPGQYFDAETGLHYNHHRDYNPILARYIESDPIGLNGGLNTYTYVLNNPLNFIDPLGLRWETVGIDYHGMKNWGMGIANRLANLEEGTIASPKNCVGCTRDVIQEWIPHPDDPQNNRNSCMADDPAPGDRRKIEQQFGEFPDPWNVNGKSWHWEPPVPSPTYQNSFEGMYY